jgi:hypothetical protein
MTSVAVGQLVAVVVGGLLATLGGFVSTVPGSWPWWMTSAT